MTSRRGFLTGLGAIIAAPAIVRASSLMPIKAERAILFDLPSEGGMVACNFSSARVALLAAWQEANYQRAIIHSMFAATIGPGMAMEEVGSIGGVTIMKPRGFINPVRA